ncbi:RrF2 family transcriptional regulator [Anaerococcus degeneri]|uniref:Rrf2 family transcriptional regulator n=1 Tax=Anaerococcus degeneri TaxID=361500 RepID=A0ABS7YZT9_9FIRM|nr:Rrf2 family transcriptional regulator [Anaerococcus degeneri]MBP2015022.1 Rrf2 family protein [Anaerococcus degeneri]MCA2097230.1 Rrf2 family transcriptional regulator [Anaerococcus degeneri]
MKLSTRGRYGLRAICYIAENQDKGFIPVSEISENLNLSENYLEQLVRMLKKDGLIKSSRGPKGGYKINKDLDSITIGQILRSLEGDMTTSECVSGKVNCDDKCDAYDLFIKLDYLINQAIDSITLDNIVKHEI